ncbi:hypothetical protein [Bdellovibrio sp. HCB2-146]|uniref:hypothetical protein n=1 Tax=Bdellovibrio sp. HCB2-146 TaxID=3394362 RepID=UPI0039BC2699
MSRFLRRSEDLDWLNRCLKLSQVVLVQGLKGIGKSTLIRMWASENKKSSKWITLSRFSTLQEALGASATTPLENVLETFLHELPAGQVVVWDDVHNADDTSKNILLHSLQNFFGDQSHILLSDHGISAPAGIPQHLLKPLSKEQSLELLHNMGMELSKKEQENYISKTGGIPLLMQLWLQSKGEVADLSRVFSELKGNEKEVLEVFALMPTGLSLTAAQKMDDSILASLQKQLLIEKHRDRYEMSSGLRDLLLEQMKGEGLKDRAQMALTLLSQDTKIAKLEGLYLNLLAENFSAISTESIDLAELEGINSNNLTPLCEAIEPALTAATPVVTSPLRRLKLHSLILQNRRPEALQEAQDILMHPLPEGRPSESEIQLRYEALHWLNRAEKFQATEAETAKLINYAQGAQKSLLRVEQAMPYMRTDLARAEEILKRALDEQRGESNIATAQAHYQLGVLFVQKKDWAKAKTHFYQAYQQYLQGKRSYFALFSLFNVAWLLFQLKDFAELETMMDRLQKAVQLHGFSYLQAGVFWIQAQMEFWNLQLGKALNSITEASTRMTASTPQQARMDILTAKARILYDLGLESETQATLDQLSQVNLKDASDRRKALEIELGINSVDTEEFQELWVQLGRAATEDAYTIWLLERGSSKNIETSELLKTRRGRMAVLESQILTQVQENNLEALGAPLNELESHLSGVSQAFRVRLALLCLRASQDSSRWLEKARLEFSQLRLPKSDHDFFHAWLQEIQGDHKSKVPNHPRWGLWRPKKQVESERYRIKTEAATMSGADAPAKGHPHSVTLLEDLGRVFVNQEQVEDFNRKSVLRQLLALLFESYPDKLSKTNLAQGLWGESYEPQVHDARIYTNIQRLRALLGEKSIENWDGGYRWNPSVAFYYYKLHAQPQLGSHRVKTLILESLKKRKQGRGENAWMSRGELVEAADSSDATVKRVLADLLKEGLIERTGKGPSVVYSIAKGKT